MTEQKLEPMDVDKKSEIQEQKDVRVVAQNIFKSRVEGYFKQLVNGCGRTNCDNFLCMSNPAIKKYKLVPNESAVLATRLALLPKQDHLHFMCSVPSKSNNTEREIEFIDLDKLQELIQESQQKGSFTSLIRIFGSVLGSPEALTLSFLKPPKLVRLDNTDTGLDLVAVAKFYEIVMDLPENVQNIVANAFDRLLGSLRYTSKNSHSLVSLRKFIFLLENPKLLDETYSNRITGLLLTLVFELPINSQIFLRDNYVNNFAKEKFLEYHQTLQDYIAVRMLQSENLVLHDDTGITSAVKMIGWFWELNKTKRFMEVSDFYNEVINDRINLRTDFFNWKKPARSNKFSLCNYPYVLNPETKSKILNIEAIISQRSRREESLQLLAQGLLDLPYFILKIRRDHLIHDSLDTITVIKMENPSDLKKQLRVKFAGEDGVDEGGVQKEWFQLFVEDIFSVKYGMFIQNDETRTHWFNQKSHDFPEFELLGTVVGLAIYNGVILDLHFPLLVYKKLCGMKPTLDDLADINPGLARGLKQLLQYNGDNIEEDINLDFQISYDYYGSLETHNLKDNGENIPVTYANRQEYVDLYVQYLLQSSVAAQFESFKKGFDTVCAGPALELFMPEELQLLICGSPDLDFTTLEKDTSYDNGYDKDHPTIKNFWEIVHKFSLEEKKKLLFFATGSDRSPIGGLGKLNFVITRHGGDTDRLPSSHTCFNHLLLPEYRSKKKMERLLKQALANSTGFGLF